MLNVTCSKCGRRYTPSTEDLQGYLAQNEGKKFALVICPHCNYGNKIPLSRLHQAVRAAPGPHEPEAHGPEAPTE